jgi:hypothetical protein
MREVTPIQVAKVASRRTINHQPSKPLPRHEADGAAVVITPHFEVRAGPNGHFHRLVLDSKASKTIADQRLGAYTLFCALLR